MPQSRTPEEAERAFAAAIRTLLGWQQFEGMGSETLERAWELVEDRSRESLPPHTDEQLLAALCLVDLVREQVNEAEGRLLQSLRREVAPVSWPRIGEALGITRQAAERRYLRSLAEDGRDADRGRGAGRAQQAAAELQQRRSEARWGRSGSACRDWSLTVRARRKRDGEVITVFTCGRAGKRPTLDVYHQVPGAGDDEQGFYWAYDLEILRVVEEVTPWRDVDSPWSSVGLDFL